MNYMHVIGENVGAVRHSSLQIVMEWIGVSTKKIYILRVTHSPNVTC